MVAIACDFQEFQDSSSLNWRMPYPMIFGAVTVEAPQEKHLRVSGTAPQWWKPVEHRLLELLQLGPDWDPRGSRQLSPDDLVDALEFLLRVMRPDTRAPWIGPLVSGGIELVWRSGNVEVEAIFDHARGERELLVSVGDNESEAPIDQAESLFAEVAERLAADDLVTA